MRTHLEIGRNFFWSALAGTLLWVQLTSGTSPADPIMKIINLEEASRSWCEQHVADDKVSSCIFQ